MRMITSARGFGSRASGGALPVSVVLMRVPSGAYFVISGSRAIHEVWEPRGSSQIGLTFFRSGARGLHVPTRLPREPAEQEARKRRAKERPRVACCEELGRPSHVRCVDAAPHPE